MILTVVHVLAVVPLLLSTIAAQGLPNIPSCGISCFTTALTGDGCAGLTDFKCHCSKTSLQTQVTSCVEKACSPSDQKAIAQTVSDTCAKIGVPISISATAPGSTSSVASSTTVASSTASVAPEAPPLEPSPASLPSTPPASAAAVIAPTTHRVDVGAAGQPTFQPNQLNAAVGDVVIFNFLGTNDTLTQSSFSNPCVGSGGFNTDFHHYNPQSLNNMFMVTYRVDSSDPQWFFCAQTVTQSHCRAGMVFAINPGEQMDTFMSNAQGGASPGSACTSPQMIPVPTPTTPCTSPQTVTVPASSSPCPSPQTVTVPASSSPCPSPQTVMVPTSSSSCTSGQTITVPASAAQSATAAANSGGTLPSLSSTVMTLIPTPTSGANVAVETTNAGGRIHAKGLSCLGLLLSCVALLM